MVASAVIQKESIVLEKRAPSTPLAVEKKCNEHTKVLNPKIGQSDPTLSPFLLYFIYPIICSFLLQYASGSVVLFDIIIVGSYFFD